MKFAAVASHVFAALVVAALLPGCLLMAIMVPPEWARMRGPSPTVDVAESPELAEGLSGTLTAASRSGVVTLVDLPSLRRRRLDVGESARRVAGPDESGRIVYEATSPRWWEFFPLTMFSRGGNREALFVRSVHGGAARLLREYRTYGYGTNLLQISRRGGRVLYAVSEDLRVYDIDGRQLYREPDMRYEIRDPWLDDDGAFLHFERVEPMAPAGPRIPSDLRRWMPRCVELATGEERDADRSLRPRSAPHWEVRPRRDPRDVDSAEDETLGQLAGDLGGHSLEFEDGRMIYAGLARPTDGARGFRSYGGFEHSLRLGERSTGRTLTLATRFDPGAWTFTEVRLEPRIPVE